MFFVGLTVKDVASGEDISRYNRYRLVNVAISVLASSEGLVIFASIFLPPHSMESIDFVASSATIHHRCSGGGGDTL